jgi:hypothetical protein
MRLARKKNSAAAEIVVVEAVDTVAVAVEIVAVEAVTVAVEAAADTNYFVISGECATRHSSCT